jgi:DNA-binding NtrC family response regulator
MDHQNGIERFHLRVLFMSILQFSNSSPIAPAVALAGPTPECVLIETPCLDWDTKELVSLCLDRHPDSPIILLEQDYTAASALLLRRLGVFEVLPRQVSPDQLEAIVEMARLQHRALRSRRRSQATPVPAWREAIVGRCPAIEKMAEVISLVAGRRSTILITGETGTGKEVVAKAIHAASERPGKLISINCAALPESLLEAELFGHTKGAFTGAQTARVGRFEAAHRGTIFLDEIGDMPLDLQAKLLRVLQEREIQRLGSCESIAVDVRVIAATNVDLLSKVEDGRFREDLYFRLNVVPLHLPALRERSGDIGVLAEHFIQKICRQEGLAPKRLSLAAFACLEEHHWPGNVRELENSVERAIALSGSRMDLLPGDFVLRGSTRKPASASLDSMQFVVPADGIDFEHIVARIERSMIEQALLRTNGNKSQAAELLRLKRTTLGAKLRSLGSETWSEAATA